MAILGAASSFSIAEHRPSGYQKHLVLQIANPRSREGLATRGGHLGNRMALVELWGEVIPAFMKEADISSVAQAGYRLAVEVPGTDDPILIHLIAGTRAVPVLSQNPHEWRSAPVVWNPFLRKPAFFDGCAASAAKGLKRVRSPFGNPVYYARGGRSVFGVRDGDPKSPTHFLVLAQQPLSCIEDPGFTADRFIQFFEVAYAICEQMGINRQGVRLVMNTGQGVQAGPRVHMHVQSDPAGLVSMWPNDYGLGITQEAKVSPIKAHPLHAAVIEAMERRPAINARTPEGLAERSQLDIKLVDDLRSILGNPGMW